MLGRRETRALLERHRLHPKTVLGQHFIIDPNTIRAVVARAGVSAGDLVVEVGAGVGALTVALVEAGASVLAIERDQSLQPALTEVLGSVAVGSVSVVWGDVMALDIGALLDGRPAVLVANLPYQIATPMLLNLLEQCPLIGSFTVMVQREVGERLAAPPGADAYGAVSAKVAYFAAASVVMRVSKRVFFPVPEVESVVVRLDRRTEPPVPGDRGALFGVITAGFAQRRKTIRRALIGAGWDAGVVEGAIAVAGIDGRARAETLGLPVFAALAAALGPRASSSPDAGALGPRASSGSV